MRQSFSHPIPVIFYPLQTRKDISICGFVEQSEGQLQLILDAFPTLF